jgi:hypothetical protein
MHLRYQKKLKSRHFGHKKAPQYCGGDFWSILISEVGAGAFFALLRFRARERETKTRARKREEKRARKKAKAPSAKEKKREFALFLTTHSGNPVSEPKADRQGGKQGS